MLSDLIIAAVFLALFIFVLADFGKLSPLETLAFGALGVLAFILLVMGTVLLGVIL
jgi:hypothetical protein